MQTVVPAIIPETFEQLKTTLELVKPFAHEVQVDIVDGNFVPFTSWPYGEHETVADVSLFAHDVLLEFDLMIKQPEEVLDAYVEAGAKRVIVHLESTENLEAILHNQSRHQFELGLSILNDTPLEELTKYIERIDYVQLMGIGDIGSQGQPFDERVLTRIKKLRSDFPNLLISIDGSVNNETLPLLKEAGANRFVSGSAILGADDPERAFTELISMSL